MTSFVVHTVNQTEKPELKKPPMFRVIMLNDDYTPMEFVTQLLMEFFHHSEETSSRITMDIHRKGSAICGIYPKDIAESKVMQVETHCRKHGHPLCCQYERHDDEE